MPQLLSITNWIVTTRDASFAKIPNIPNTVVFRELKHKISHVYPGYEPQQENINNN